MIADRQLSTVHRSPRHSFPEEKATAGALQSYFRSGWAFLIPLPGDRARTNAGLVVLPRRRPQDRPRAATTPQQGNQQRCYLAAYLLYAWLRWPVNPASGEGILKAAKPMASSSFLQRLELSLSSRTH